MKKGGRVAANSIFAEVSVWEPSLKFHTKQL